MWTKSLTRSHVRNDRLSWLLEKMMLVLTGKTQQWGCAAGGHIAAAVRERRKVSMFSLPLSAARRPRSADDGGSPHLS